MAEKKSTTSTKSTTKTKSAPKKPTETKSAPAKSSSTSTQSTTTKSTTQKSSSSKKSSNSNIFTKWGINKISFYTICAVAVLYLIAMILAACGVSSVVVSALQGLASAIMICIVAVLGWRYVRTKPIVWQVLYGVCLLVVILGIIIPLVI